MPKILYSIQEASELSGLGINTIKKFIELDAVIPENIQNPEMKINSFGIRRLKEISRMLDKGLSKYSIVRRIR